MDKPNEKDSYFVSSVPISTDSDTNSNSTQSSPELTSSYYNYNKIKTNKIKDKNQINLHKNKFNSKILKSFFKFKFKNILFIFSILYLINDIILYKFQLPFQELKELLNIHKEINNEFNSKSQFDSNTYTNTHNNNNNNNNNKNFMRFKDLKTDEHYYYEFINTKYYKNRPELHGLNPFNTTETVERLLNLFPYDPNGLNSSNSHETLTSAKASEKNIIQMWLNLKDEMAKENGLKSSNQIDDDDLYYDEFNEYDKYDKFNEFGEVFDPLTNKTIKKISEMELTESDYQIDDFQDIDDIPNLLQRNSWVSNNPTYNYKMYTSYKQYKLEIKQNFAEILPEVMTTFNLLPKVILKSDFGRYLLIFLYGGVYGDIDTYCHKPIDEWFGSDIDSGVGFVTGIESDNNIENWKDYYPRRVQFIQWSFKSRKHHPLLALLIANIVKLTFQAKLDNKLSAWTPEFTRVDKCRSIEIMDWTGPGIFTDTVYEYATLQAKQNPIKFTEIDEIYYDLVGPKKPSPESVDWRIYTGLSAPVVIGDLAVYPIDGFRAPLDCEGKTYCYVTHYYSGTWKSDVVN
ncbi:hypothetical protein B5S32_g847 [[Candida] boidinii]|nr:hypothetical protein B5S32_g847 [[Candida] boidinii]